MQFISNISVDRLVFCPLCLESDSYPDAGTKDLGDNTEVGPDTFANTTSSNEFRFMFLHINAPSVEAHQ